VLLNDGCVNDGRAPVVRRIGEENPRAFAIPSGSALWDWTGDDAPSKIRHFCHRAPGGTAAGISRRSRRLLDRVGASFAPKYSK
jgi:hypothetical protein